MEAQQTKEVKAVIEQEIIKTKALVKEYKEITQPIEPENAIGRISRMDAINNKSVNEAALRQAQEKLKKLEYALKHVEAEGFGICARCNKSIPIGRVMIMPQSRFCVNCAG